jgi:hypothetical protein
MADANANACKKKGGEWGLGEVNSSLLIDRVFEQACFGLLAKESLLSFSLFVGRVLLHTQSSATTSL